MIEIVFPVECYDRELVIVADGNKEKILELMGKAYEHWLEATEDVHDLCCEEYICQFLEDNGIEFYVAENISEISIFEYVKELILSIGGVKEDVDQILDEIKENGYTTIKEVKGHLENYYL